MRKSTFVYLVMLCGVTLIICSYAGGASSHNIEGTGAETGLGNSAGCGQGCHTSATTTTINIELDSAGVPVTRYVGGKSYTVKLTGKNTSTTSLPEFGFQIGCIVGSTAVTTPTNAGSWIAPFPTNTKYVAPKSGKFVVGVVEQTAAIAATSGTGGNGTTYVQTFNWTAPAAGTGTISFWAVINAVNGNNNDTGDKYNTGHVTITELTPVSTLKVSTSVVNVKCNGDKTGSATATASGGKPSYTYSWNTSPVQTTATATGLAAGSYTVTVKDAVGTTTNQVAVISQPSAITITTTPVNATSCTASDGSITSNVSGGSPPYTYAWSNSKTTANISTLATGTYTLTVTDANSCKQTATATVNCPNGTLTVTASGTNVTCFGNNDGTATASPSGTQPYTFSWSTVPVQTTAKAIGLAPGTYTVTVKDATKASKTATVTITSPTEIIADLATTPVTSCLAKDGSITATVSGGSSPYIYSWSNGSTSNALTGLASGSYTLTITDANGCKKTAIASVNKSGTIPISISNPLREGFETSSNLPSNWTLDNPDGDAAWQVVTTLSHTGSNCIGFNNCDGNGPGNSVAGTKDKFITAVYDFTNTTATANLTFDLAYAVLQYKNKTLSDSLAIYSSTDCGISWDLLYLKGGPDLSPIVTSVSCWTPTASDWRNETISLSKLSGKSSVLFAFENRSNWGEWIYIDDININATVGVDKLNALQEFKIYPNPASDLFYIEGISDAKKIHFSIYNVVGEEIQNGDLENNAGSFTEKIQVTDFSKGMYFIKLSDSKNVWTRKININ
ncbi:MAG TPA: T9SS type A sorting domain-containing protein [Bacteroidia bacterium]|nr:T9SS type A sorting domain-containing protein [Bacteroidia bacterium]